MANDSAAVEAAVNTKRTCAWCRYMKRETVSDMACTRFPPNIQMFLTPPPMGSNQPGQLRVTAFPIVQPNWGCGEYATKVVV